MLFEDSINLYGQFRKGVAGHFLQRILYSAAVVHVIFAIADIIS